MRVFEPGPFNIGTNHATIEWEITDQKRIAFTAKAHGTKRDRFGNVKSVESEAEPASKERVIIGELEPGDSVELEFLLRSADGSMELDNFHPIKFEGERCGV